MANTTRITMIHRHLGTAAERGAMSTTGLPIGSTFEETDTKLVYIWDPVTDTWYLHPAISATLDDLTILGTLISTPSTAQVINAAGDAILANALLVELNPDADYTLTSAPTIANGTEGQWLLITVAAGEANTVTVQDQGTLASTNILLKDSIAFKTIADGDTLALRFNGTDWVEMFGPTSAGVTFATFTDGDTTPSVAGNNYFKTANTGATTITDFGDPSTNGHEITIDFGDALTTIQASANIRLQGGVTSPTNDYGPSVAGVSLTLYYNGTQWREKSRSVNV